MIAHLEQVTVVQTSNPHCSPQKTFPQPHPSAPQPQSYFHLSTATNSQFGSEFNKSGICNLRSPPDAHCCNRPGCGGLHPGFQCPSSQSTDMPHQEPQQICSCQSLISQLLLLMPRDLDLNFRAILTRA